MTTLEALPLRAVDDVEVLDGAEGDGDPVRTVLARKRVTDADPYLDDHFPGRPVYPGVFVLETVQQAVSVALAGSAAAPARTCAIRSLRFLSAARPGDSAGMTRWMAPIRGG